ncbi:uncharacterized protein N0V89_009045 [Didymosphaeria variabile]|uniref:Uncharacterized protein n=1 Tax=Didymosphaeria variabile TaxID=1932322 RepID=A0A9W8XGW3_9PLEO|nr:uncharacterized protein N0V89_009045 [Didymosphaeria variabile]KAJ4350424.1 hypothetical protein N0V89_009045 [Didymosphaeria variabile]
MATASLRKTSWLALLAGVSTVTAQSSSSAFWTFTTRYQDCIDTYTGIYSTYTTSSTCTIKDSVTPTATPYEVSGKDTSDYYGYEYSDLQVFTAWYTAGAVPDSDLKPTYNYDLDATTTTERTTSTYYEFSMQVTYTAPTDCPTPFTFTTNASVTVPTQVLDQVTPYATVVSTPAPTRRASYVYETWYLTEGQAPFTSEEDYYYTAYIEECSTPYNAYSSYSYTSGYSYPTGRTSGGSGGSSDGYSYCYYGYGTCTSLRTWVIVIAAVIPGLFVLGFFESYFWFRRLMLGKGCLRFGTISWICISLWVACFTRSQSRRSPEDQKLLRQKWRETSFGTAIGLWFKWGFRHRYPVPLLGQYSRNTVGIVPEGQPLPLPGMLQTNANYPGGPPPPPGAFIPNGQGQPYYPPPQGWAPAPNAQGYPMPPPGQAYMPPNGAVQYYGYGAQTKDAPSVTATSVSPVNGAPQPAPSPVSPTVAPQIHDPNVAEAPATTQTSAPAGPQAPAPTQLPTHQDRAV